MPRFFMFLFVFLRTLDSGLKRLKNIFTIKNSFGVRSFQSIHVIVSKYRKTAPLTPPSKYRKIAYFKNLGCLEENSGAGNLVVQS